MPGDGIYFHDLREMLSPSSSLSSFASMCKLKEEKLSFPFGAFTDRQFLDREGLPTSRDDWFDCLRQSAPSQEHVDEVVREFQAHNFQSVGEYLHHYLKGTIANFKIDEK